VPALQQLDAGLEPDRFWTIGGTLRGLGDRSPRLTLVEKGLEVSLQPEGRFVIGRLQAGQYTLEVIVDSQPARRYPITVPAPDYDLEL
jgi:hypothetical protein